MEQPYDRLPSPTTFFVAVGASGQDGLRDIEALINAFPPRLPAAVLIVLHAYARWVERLEGMPLARPN
jgi:chemotaxis response regulator CheB